MSPRDSRRSISSSGSRFANRRSDPDIFSDEYALESLDIPETSPFDADDDPTPTSTRSSLHTATDISQQVSPDLIISNPTLPPSISHKQIGLRDATYPIPNRAASSASNTISDVHRASSTSSHFTMPRSQSPYVGATAPSHPYGMYPQITRTSSIASASTVRPIERPFVAPSGPEHPYAMYSQNTVPEEDDASLVQATIPLGFPGMGQQYQSRAQPRRDDIANIVSSDGHVEELPPYTRYADEIAPKERAPSIRSVNLPAVVPEDVPVSPQSLRTQFPNSSAELNPSASQKAESHSSGSFKEKIKQKSKQRVCGGLPFWFFLVIFGVLLLGVVLGAIIGGVIGSRKGTLATAAADSAQNSSVPTATVTSTAFIDATPLATNLAIPDVPNGQYNFPNTNIGQNSQACIQNTDLSDAWMCMPPFGLGINIIGQRMNAGLILDSYPLNASFMYGAQPPDLHPRQLNLSPSMDMDSTDLGPSLFAWTYYDKLTILHEQDLQANGQYKRDRSQEYGVAGDKPWFCWFNHTVLEFFIYVDRKVNLSATTTTTSTTTSPSTTPSTFATSASTTSSSSSPPPITSSAKGPFQSYHPDIADFTKSPFTASIYKEKRDLNGKRRNNYDDYPLLVKIEEKRKPSGNIKPYCQQMQILDNLDIVPKLEVAKISVPEVEDKDPPSSKRMRRRGDDVDQNCACEWMSG